MNIYMGRPSKMEKVKINSSVFDKKDSVIRPKLILVAGLSFSMSQDPFKLLYDLLIKCGFKNPEELKNKYPHPGFPLMCREVSSEFKSFRLKENADLVLKSALLLGLSSKYQYNPSRPVIWTAASLNRKIELYEPGGFYA